MPTSDDVEVDVDLSELDAPRFVMMDEDELRMLLNERDSLRRNLTQTQERCSQLLNEQRSLRAALKRIQAWDCLNPPRIDLCADLPWLRCLVDEALKGS